MNPEDRSLYPRYMSDEGRIKLAIDLLDEAFCALCWIGCDSAGLTIGVVRPKHVEKAINRIDKTMTALEKYVAP